LTPQFKTEEKDRLFYSQWAYAVSWYQPEVSAMRQLDHEEIKESIEYKRQWNSWSRTVIQQSHVDNLHALCDLLLAETEPFKKVITSHWITIYTNSDSTVNRLTQNISAKETITVRKAVVTKPKDTVLLKDPRHKYRVYLKSRTSTPEVRQRLNEFFNTHEDIRVGPSLKHWLSHNSTWVWTMDYFFFDINDPGYVTWFGLTAPGLIRKTMTIQAK
jgi:hypothetical protein